MAEVVLHRMKKDPQRKMILWGANFHISRMGNDGRGLFSDHHDGLFFLKRSQAMKPVGV
jgi:hypothetical protein